MLDFRNDVMMTYQKRKDGYLSFLFFGKSNILLILDDFDVPVSGELGGGGELVGSPGIFKPFHSSNFMLRSLQNTNAIILHSVKITGKIRDVLFLNFKRDIIISMRIAMAVGTGYSFAKFNPTDKSSSLLKALAPLFCKQ